MQLAQATSRETTGSIRKPNNPAAISGSLKSGLDALSDGDTERARAIRNGMSKSALDQHILTWAIAVVGGQRRPVGGNRNGRALAQGLARPLRLASPFGTRALSGKTRRRSRSSLLSATPGRKPPRARSP